ncbi:MAG TPA: polyphosphate kinase 2 family protein [Tepidisphaeraceae bacterium]|jgi:PPK2 family polyphosphate:nucleotide phosphotransferase
MSHHSHLIRPGTKVKLSEIDPGDTGRFKKKTRKEAEAASAENLKAIHDIQEVLYAEGKHAVLVVLQAMDAGGKDGTIDYIFSGMNPQGCEVSSFKVPSSLEKLHDFLWRHHAEVPAKGMIGIFNRSHYEAVLVERVRKFAPEAVWKKRFNHINCFEQLLADEGTTIIKFFLHISREEQAERMRARLDDPTKNWKFNPGDLEERKLWDDYQAAYEDVLSKCSTEAAPWYVIPADKKWYRNYAISEVLRHTLEALKPKFPPPLADLEQYRVI